MMAPAIWINGQRQPASGPHVSARDRGLLLGDGVFETMRAHAGRIFRFDRHLSRLQGALTVLRIPVPDEIRDWVLAALPDASGEEASVRLTVTRGEGPAGVAPPLDSTPTVIVAVGPLPSFPASVYESGLRAHVASGRRNERAMTVGLKTIAFTDAIAALLEAHQAKADEALFLDTGGHCSEATSSNLFIWAGGTLVTPPLSCAALPGITRASVLELAAARGMAAVERPFGPEELMAADEAFLTSSLRGIAPLVRVDGRSIGAGTPGRVTQEMAAAYADLVARECRGLPDGHTSSKVRTDA
jgi:branched-chain amino acid aminotransferase